MANFTIPRKNIKKIDIIVESLTAPQVYKKYKPDYFINLALYDMNRSTNITFMEDENKKSGFLFSSYGIGIKGEKELVWVDKNTAFANNQVRDFCSGSPTLVRNGQSFINWGNKVGSHSIGKHFRSFIGFNNDNLFLVASDNKLSIPEEVNICRKFNMEFAINADGGDSVHLQKGSNVIRKSTRRNASWLLVYMNKQQTEVLSNGRGQPLPFIL